MKKRVFVTIMVFMLVFGMTGYVYAKDETSDSKKQTSSDAGKKNEKKEDKKSSKKSKKKNTKKNTKKNKKKSKKKNGKKKAKKTDQNKTGNPLLDAEVKIGDVMNGTKTEKLGEYAYIEVPLDTMKDVTMEQYDEFCNKKVQDSGYKWVTIDFKNGTGLQFQGSTPAVSTYGTLDREECIEEQYGIVMMKEEHTYEYSAFE